VREAFFDSYQALFERTVRDVPVETMSWRLAASAPTPNISLHFGGQPVGQGEPVKGRREAYFAGFGKVQCAVYDRYAFKPGFAFDGPAVIEERESTTVLGPDAGVTVDDFLNLVVSIG